MKRFLPILAGAWILVFAAPLRAQNITAQSVSTQQLTLNAQNPVPTPAGVNVTSSIAGSSTYYYWIVTHSGSEISAPAGPYVASNAPATLGGIYSNSIVWTPTVSGGTYDLLRTGSSATPAGACSCAVGTALTNTSFTDGLSSTTSYSVSTSADQVPLVCTNVTGCAGSGGIANTSNGSITISQNCAGIQNCFQTPWNTQSAGSGSWTNNSTTVNCSTCNFQASDVGKRIAGYSTCATSLTIDAVNSLGRQAGTVISAVNSSTQVTVSNAATATQASGGCVYWGNPDDSALTSAEAFGQTLKTCPVFVLPAGYGMAVQPHFFSVFNPCSGLPETEGSSYTVFGYQVRGQGPNNTILFLPPDFDMAACTHGVIGNGCFGGSANLFYNNWGITGGGLATTNASNPKILIYLADTGTYGNMTNFSCSNFGAADTNLTGVANGGNFHGKLFESSIDGCGSSEVENSGTLVLEDDGIQDGNFAQLVNSGSASDLGQTYFQPSPQTQSGADVISNSGSLNFSHTGAAANGNVSGQIVEYHGKGSSSITCSACDFDLTGNTSSSSQAFRLDSTSVAGINSTFINGASGLALFLNGTSTEITDQGGNKVVGGSNISGKVFRSDSITATALATTNVTPSTGWGTSGAAGNGVSNPLGDSRNMSFTITAAGTPSANPTTAISFPTSFWVAPICSISQIGGTGVLSDAITAAPTGSAVSFTWQGTPVSGSTYIFVARCQ